MHLLSPAIIPARPRPAAAAAAEAGMRAIKVIIVLSGVAFALERLHGGAACQACGLVGFC